jgi:hypothetical protein
LTQPVDGGLSGLNQKQIKPCGAKGDGMREIRVETYETGYPTFIYIDDIQVGIGEKKACEDLADELKASKEKTELVFNIFKDEKTTNFIENLFK